MIIRCRLVAGGGGLACPPLPINFLRLIYAAIHYAKYLPKRHHHLFHLTEHIESIATVIIKILTIMIIMIIIKIIKMIILIIMAMIIMMMIPAKNMRH